MNAGLWAAAYGGARENAELLLARGADPQWLGWDDLTAEGAARRSGFTALADWLGGRP